MYDDNAGSVLVEDFPEEPPWPPVAAIDEPIERVIATELNTVLLAWIRSEQLGDAPETEPRR